MKRIGDILTRNKTRVTVEDGISYKQVTIRTNYKGVALRGVQDGSTIGTKEQFRVSAGQFILSRIDARNGAFGIIPEELEGAIVTNDFLAFDINENEVETEFFNVFLQSPIFLEACIKASRGNTNRKRVDEDFFLNYEVNLPSLPEQHQLIKRINKARVGIETAQHEITRQQSLLAKLKQAILQEAIQGKLSADWRVAHPDAESVSKLLQRIQAEKTRLVAAKKLRKEDHIQKVNPEEKLFEIPEGWSWCRLLEVSRQIHYGFTVSADVSRTGARLLRITDIQDDRVNWGTVPGCNCTASEAKKYRLSNGDILIARTGGTVGKSYLVDAIDVSAIFASYLLRVVPAEVGLSKYLKLYFGSSCYWNQLMDAARGAQPNVSGSKLQKLVVPLPPLAEQKAIVEKVEALLVTCRALEAEIEHSRTHSAHLLQAVLREAFSGKLVAQEANDKPATATAKVIPFPAPNLTRIANISPTDLQAGIIAMAYQRHEQTPKFLQYFHHVKTEKIVHLVEAHLGIDLKRMPVKAAAGPNDYPHLKKVESRARKASWFDVRQAKTGGAHTYHKKSSFDALLDKTAAALGERAAEVEALINLLLPMDTRQAEIVATLYAAWNNLLLLGHSPGDEDIVYEARENWHTSKLEIERERFFKALVWMREHGLIPAGKGRYVDAK